jgi:hypothetical protein
MSQAELKEQRYLTIATSSGKRIDLPDSLKGQLTSFRNRVWASKTTESVLLAVVVACLSLLTVYFLDRWIDTPLIARFMLFAIAALIWLALPRALYRWVWMHRRLEQLARLLRRNEPTVGDQLLSAIELAHDDSEQARSRTLCAAAIEQVSVVAGQRDLRQAAPANWLKPLAVILLLAAITIAALSTAFPAAFSNALARLAMPWRSTPRYTFTMIEPLKHHQIVPHGETTELRLALTAETKWRPTVAHLRLGSLPVVSADLTGNNFVFSVPALTDTTQAVVQVGDLGQVLTFQPMLRPGLVEATAEIELPKYLQRAQAIEQDIRSGKLTAVVGSQASIRAVASRELSTATLNQTPLTVQDKMFRSSAVSVSASSPAISINWQDLHGLTPSSNFELTVQALEDEAPSIVGRELPRQLVVMESEQTNFEALASDDFGVKRIGFSWRGLDQTTTVKPAQGERILAGGGPEQNAIQTPAVFCASDLGIAAQPIELRLWSEDYLPERSRTYSSPHILFVLTAEQHAIWIMDQLSKWHKAAIDVRDKEMQLHEENKRLRELSADELADDKMREALRRQAALEAANARRLSALTQSGESMVKTASRNPEIGVGHLERWAEMLQVLNDIGNNRMPSVSDLLDDASTAKQLARGNGGKPAGPRAGMNRSSAAATKAGQSEDDGKDQKPSKPRVSDQESSLAGTPEGESPAADKKKKSGAGRLTLPTTTVVDSSQSKKPTEPSPDASKPDESVLEQAIEEQADLLAEFQKIADELNDVLANMEGSTLVKRLKAASRDQVQVAEMITSRLPGVFGMPNKADQDDRELFKSLTSTEEKNRQTVSYIMDDLQGYFERRRMNQFRVVLDEMKETKILDALTDLGEAIPKKQGVSIAHAEYWADNLDRWADELVDPACSGQCPGCKSSDALPPSMILEAMRILEAEVNLREATRVAEHARAATEIEDFKTESERLSDVQQDILDRTGKLAQAIIDLPEGQARFGKELQILSGAGKAMGDAARILASHSTGTEAIAAETEAIEWLLRSKKINPRGGGGGGTDPGGGGTGTTQDSALALMGSGLNAKEKRQAREVAQSVGDKVRSLPEEFRQGLDQYFNQLEKAE